MSVGPTIIFDKSAIQGISVDESMWLESFYITNITPLFFVETLADLEKEIKSGRTPEDVVGDIALKISDMGCVNVYHRDLIIGDLMGNGPSMTNRPVISGGRTVELEGKTGIIFQESPEMEAAKRWEQRKFLEIERTIARNWREELVLMAEEDYSVYYKLFEAIGKPKTFEDLKRSIDNLVTANEKNFFDYSMALIGLMPEARQKILTRWESLGSKPIKEFAPYFAYIFSVDMVFHIGQAGNMFKIFPHSGTHKVDLAYLYYLPFCDIFTSNDKFHIRIAPLFMGVDQTFITGSDFKADLTKLNIYYDQLPDDIKNRGAITFAPCPPDDISFLTTRLWDKYMAKTWRNLKDSVRKFDGTEKIDPKVEKEILDNLRKFTTEAKTVSPDHLPNSDKADHIMRRIMVSAAKGKWKKFPPEVLNSKPILDDKK